MSNSFYLWLSVCVASLLYAGFDSANTLDEYRNSTGAKRKLKFLKLLLLWFMPIMTFVATLVSAKESRDTDRRSEGQSKEIARLSNEVVVVRSDLELQQNPPFVVRLKQLLDEIDPKIIPGLTNGRTNIVGFITSHQKHALKRLAAESNNVGILILKPDIESMSVSADHGTVVSVNFDVSPDFMKRLAGLQVPSEAR